MGQPKVNMYVYSYTDIYVCVCVFICKEIRAEKSLVKRDEFHRVVGLEAIYFSL